MIVNRESVGAKKVITRLVKTWRRGTNRELQVWSWWEWMSSHDWEYGLKTRSVHHFSHLFLVTSHQRDPHPSQKYCTTQTTKGRQMKLCNSNGGVERNWTGNNNITIGLGLMASCQSGFHLHSTIQLDWGAWDFITRKEEKGQTHCPSTNDLHAINDHPREI